MRMSGRPGAVIVCSRPCASKTSRLPSAPSQAVRRSPTSSAGPGSSAWRVCPARAAGADARMRPSAGPAPRPWASKRRRRPSGRSSRQPSGACRSRRSYSLAQPRPSGPSSADPERYRRTKDGRSPEIASGRSASRRNFSPVTRWMGLAMPGSRAGSAAGPRTDPAPQGVWACGAGQLRAGVAVCAGAAAGQGASASGRLASQSGKRRRARVSGMVQAPVGASIVRLGSGFKIG